MKIGKINSRLSRFGSKVRGDISKAVGKTSKVISQAERGVKKGISEVAKVADSEAVRGLQQATKLGGAALMATGTPVGMAAGGALLSAHEGIKATRKAIPDKAEKAKKQVGGVARQAQAQVLAAGRAATAGVRKAEVFKSNVLEKKEPVSAMDELPNYVD